MAVCSLEPEGGVLRISVLRLCIFSRVAVNLGQTMILYTCMDHKGT